MSLIQRNAVEARASNPAPKSAQPTVHFAPGALDWLLTPDDEPPTDHDDPDAIDWPEDDEDLDRRVTPAGLHVVEARFLMPAELTLRMAEEGHDFDRIVADAIRLYLDTVGKAGA